MNENRVAQVTVALVGYQPGDRVVVKKVLGDWPGLRDRHGVIDPTRWGKGHDRDWFLVRFDEPPCTNGKDAGWWVDRSDMSPE